MTTPLRFVVELRPPRKGERYVGVSGEVFEAHGHFNTAPRWVIVDPVPADPAKEPQ
jgi:hypothetical protein